MTAVEPRDTPTTTLSLIKLALEQGLDPVKLGQLFELHKACKADAAREAFAVAMNACQAEMPAVVRDAKNAHTNSRYVRLETLTRVAKPVYTRHGFSLSFSSEDCPLQHHVRIIAICRHNAGHFERYQKDVPLDGQGSQGNKSAMNAIQGSGSTDSYAQRYMTKLIFNIVVADEDDDAEFPITEDQIGEINDLLTVCVDSGKPVDFTRFLKWLGVESLDMLPSRSFAKAIHELKRKAGVK